MHTKKYLITGLLGLAIVAIGGFFLIRHQGFPIDTGILRDGSLYSYVPGYADQLIYIRVDEDLLASLKKMDPSQYGTSFQQLVQRVDTALVTQYATGDIVYNLLFLKGEEVDITELQALGLLADAENNQAKQLTDTLWLYGPKHALDWQAKTSYTLQDNPSLYEYIQQIHAGKYNIGFLTNPLTAEKNLPFVEQFSDKLLYTALMTRLGGESIAGTLQLQFAEGIITDRDSSFVPAFVEWVGKDTLVYAEMYDLWSLFGIDESQFMSLAPLVLGQYGQAYGALLSQEDYRTVYDALHSHVGIFLNASSQSILGIGASLVFDTPGLYDILTMMHPVWVGLFGGMVGSGSVQVEQTPTGVAYTSTSSLLGGVEGLTLLSIDKGSSSTTFSLLGGVVATGNTSTYTPIYTDATSFVFRIDSDGLEALGGYQPLMGEIAGPKGTKQMLQGIFQGNLQTDAQKSRLLVNFSVSPQ